MKWENFKNEKEYEKFKNKIKTLENPKRKFKKNKVNEVGFNKKFCENRSS